jgi:ribulose-5-phosphate 4-epimerase/fuculose-1-phosphate aldolase
MITNRGGTESRRFPNQSVSPRLRVSAVCEGGERLERRRFLLACSAGVLAVAQSVAAQGTAGSKVGGLAAPPLIEDDVVAANRVLAMEGVLDGMGHVSVRHNARPSRFLLARSMAPELVTSADILEYDLDGQPIDARGRTSYLERFIHSEIYRARPDVHAVVHCHTPSLIPFAASDVPLRAMYHMAAFVADGVPVWDIRKAAGVTDLLVRDAALGRALAQTLGNKAAALMRGHGAVVVASSIPNVVGRAIYLDINARAQAQAVALGGRLTYVEADEAKLRMADPNEYSRAWELWKRKAQIRP